MHRALEVFQNEGITAFVRAGIRKILRWAGMYPELTLPKALKEMNRLWPEDAVTVRPGVPRVSIIVLTYNNLDYTRLCLRSIFANSRALPFEVVIVDNASSDATPNFLRVFTAKHTNVKLILNSENLGFSAGNNLGASQAQGDFLVFLNNDTIVTPGWIEGLLHHLEQDHAGMVGPRTNFWGNESRIKVRYPNLKSLIRFSTALRQKNLGRSFDIHTLAFYCVALRRQVYEQVGPLDEQFGVGMFEDDDYSARLSEKGYRVVCAEDVFIHHWGKASFSKLERERYQRLFEENRRKFEEKWERPWQAE